MKDNKELTLFGNIDEFTLWKKEWKDMPEFIQEDLEPWRTIKVCFEDYFKLDGHLVKGRIIYVHFENLDNIHKFGKLLGISGITCETKYLKLNSLEKFTKVIAQKITDTTPSVWFPEVTDEIVRNKRWIDEE